MLVFHGGVEEIVILLTVVFRGIFRGGIGSGEGIVVPIIGVGIGAFISKPRGRAR